MTQDKEYDGSTPITGRYGVLQEAFVDNIIAGLPQYEAYRKAGYKGKNEQIIRTNSTHLITTNNNVKARLAYKRAQLAKKADVTAERVIKEFAKVGFANIADFYDEKNELKPINAISKADMAAVDSIEQERKGKTTKTKFKLHSKIAALDKLANHLGMYQDVEPNTTINVVINKVQVAVEAAK